MASERYRQVVVGNVILTSFDHEVEGILGLDPRWLVHYGLRRGDVVVVETVEEETITETRREYRHGFEGQEREVVVGRQRNIVSSESFKLWHNAAGWYWIEQ